MTAYGIDFGTTNSVLASWSRGETEVVPIDSPPGEWSREGFDRVLPSVLAVGPDGGWRFGWEAKRPGMKRLDAVKRLLATEDEVRVGAQELMVEEAASALFGRLRSGGRSAGVDFDQAVVTIPANSRGLARYRTRICAGLAGIEVLALLNEPTAAAMAFAHQIDDGGTVLVVDLGGGTYDVTLLQVAGGIFMETASSGVQRLGGIDFDNEIARRVMDKVAGSNSWGTDQRQEFLLEVELAKIRLSSIDEVALPVPGGGSRTLQRAEVLDWIGPLLDRLVAPVQDVLNSAGMTLADVDHLLLVGGSCRMPAVRERIIDVVRREPAGGVDPMTAVAEGAAAAAAMLKGEYDAKFFVTTEHALGTIVRDPDPGTSYSVIIERNATLPARETRSYVPVRDFQENIDVSVIEGDERRALDDPANVMLADWLVPLGEPRPQAEVAVDVTFEYDRDGIIHVTVVDQVSQELLHRGSVGDAVGRSPEELHGIRTRVEVMVEEVSDLGAGAVSNDDPAEADLTPESSAAIERARVKVIPLVGQDDAAMLEGLVEALLSEGGGGGEPAALAELESALRKWAYLF